MKREITRTQQRQAGEASGRCEWCRWGTEVEALKTRLIRCELRSQAYVAHHTCHDFERQPGADE